MICGATVKQERLIIHSGIVKPILYQFYPHQNKILLSQCLWTMITISCTHVNVCREFIRGGALENALSILSTVCAPKTCTTFIPPYPPGRAGNQTELISLPNQAFPAANRKSNSVQIVYYSAHQKQSYPFKIHCQVVSLLCCLSLLFSSTQLQLQALNDWDDDDDEEEEGDIAIGSSGRQNDNSTGKSEKIDEKNEREKIYEDGIGMDIEEDSRTSERAEQLNSSIASCSTEGNTNATSSSASSCSSHASAKNGTVSSSFDSQCQKSQFDPSVYFPVLEKLVAPVSVVMLLGQSFAETELREAFCQQTEVKQQGRMKDGCLVAETGVEEEEAMGDDRDISRGYVSELGKDDLKQLQVDGLEFLSRIGTVSHSIQELLCKILISVSEFSATQRTALQFQAPFTVIDRSSAYIQSSKQLYEYVYLVGNMAMDDNTSFTSFICQSYALTRLHSALFAFKRHIVNEALFALSNIATEDEGRQKIVETPGLIGTCCRLLVDDWDGTWVPNPVDNEEEEEEEGEEEEEEGGEEDDDDRQYSYKEEEEEEDYDCEYNNRENGEMDSDDKLLRKNQKSSNSFSSSSSSSSKDSRSSPHSHPPLPLGLSATDWEIKKSIIRLFSNLITGTLPVINKLIESHATAALLDMLVLETARISEVERELSSAKGTKRGTRNTSPSDERTEVTSQIQSNSSNESAAEQSASINPPQASPSLHKLTIPSMIILDVERDPIYHALSCLKRLLIRDVHRTVLGSPAEAAGVFSSSSAFDGRKLLDCIAIREVFCIEERVEALENFLESPIFTWRRTAEQIDVIFLRRVKELVPNRSECRMAEEDESEEISEESEEGDEGEDDEGDENDETKEGDGMFAESECAEDGAFCKGSSVGKGEGKDLNEGISYQTHKNSVFGSKDGIASCFAQNALPQKPNVKTHAHSANSLHNERLNAFVKEFYHPP
eukprot:MONOS_1879.1-p1 / transcript=MONOS_1879.1 / gene=MONOS_1879 / organism=Monocercomonoides_exilis_PA203 / gene_product=unspecified product / transcript_product=unspecified product / location=Mono_scaffold00036:8985-12277(-) / protein_length=945 / sequence_SO=supercontig / SO=protein_coding / is_pseudo=false